MLDKSFHFRTENLLKSMTFKLEQTNSEVVLQPNWN